MSVPQRFQHPLISRRTAIQAGAVGMLGLGMNHLGALRAAGTPAGSARPAAKARSCIYIFLSGGLAQHESFDLKPSAPAEVRGEFQPIATSSPGVEISEHLPGLAQRSRHWAILRSLTHPTNDHTLGHYYMLTGRSIAPGFRGDRQPRPTDWPSLASIVGDALPPRSNNLPPAIVLPERLVHWSGGVIPGAYGGQMGGNRDPFFIEASPYGNPFWRGAYPEYTFPNEAKKPPQSPDDRVYQAPNLSLPVSMTVNRLDGRLGLLRDLEIQRQALERSAALQTYDNHRQSAISLLADPGVRRAFDVTHADDRTQERYGRNSFGWSLLMAYRLVEAGVNLVQVNLGNNETWDSHGEIFPRLKNKLFPPTDRALCALLDDLQSTGLLDSTLIVMASEFGRTPKLSTLPGSFDQPGRDHWGAVQSVFFAGGGIPGGTVIGSSDALGGYPASNPQSPENMAATIYHALGIPHEAVWHDEVTRPHNIYNGEPIPGLV
ncbi:MAG TPA: DUF1501 domain-containing protein [Planctomycetaceae bacterium]|nr:DUF1501 domain-containing protein [Planctomycetaceae bacterium]